MSECASPYLTPNEEQLLLQIARDSLTTFVHEKLHLDLERYPLTPALLEAHGAFVSLRHKGALRGCIGYTKNVEPLAEAIRDNAINAGTRDPRFNPISPEELDDVVLEISALCPGEKPDSPFIKVNDIRKIVLGRDGLYLEHAGPGGGGLLLPQVPGEQGWDLDGFLDGLCQKAGVPKDGWKAPGATLYRFSAQVFSEESDVGGS
jgi:uncharacterized protein